MCQKQAKDMPFVDLFIPEFGLKSCLSITRLGGLRERLIHAVQPL